MDLKGAQSILDHLPPAALAVTAAERQERLLFLQAVKLRSSLLAGRLGDAETLALKALELDGDFASSPGKGQLYLQLARYYETRGETMAALEWAKKAVIQFQACESPAGERQARIELGSIMLAEGRCEEAQEYFSATRQKAPPGLAAEELRALALSTVSHLVIGNLSRALTQAEEGCRSAASLKRREWELFLAFLKARILFELGAYAQSNQGFQEALALAGIYAFPQAQRVIAPWLGRSFAYLGAAESAFRLFESLGESRESLYFQAEAWFQTGRNAEALSALARISTLGQEPATFPAERILWQDGFAAVEGRCFNLLRDSGLLGRLVRSFQAYLWGLAGEGERGIAQLYAITRGERLPEVDPYASLYHYYYACILPELRQVEVDDGLTVLNKALILLQQRAAAIEDSTIRYEYLHRNYWNARLLEAAQRKKLI